ncbi:MAG: phosphatidylglycerophosphatase A [Alphaproteobacteria bacterium]
MKQTLIHKAYKIIAGLGPVGNLPASGTWGSLAALPFAWLLRGSPFLPLLVILSFIIGVLAIRPLIEGKQEKDPSFVIIDEFMGQLAVFCLIPKECMSPLILIFGFLFFRLFDILKPWPASFFDRKVHTGFGVMMDDFAAAIYAMISLALMMAISYTI